jgi:hypothetical protein
VNIVYLLTNKSKTEGKRFYIGAKVECKLLEINGVPTIFNVKTGKPYYGSSSSFEFKEDFKRGDIFVASILEVTSREDLFERERYYIDLHNAIESDDYYNMSSALDHSYNHHKTLKNSFGETVAEYAAACSQVSKRDNTAKTLGFRNFGELYFTIQDRLDAGEKVKDISASFGKHRKWVQITLEPYNMQKAREDLFRYSAEKLRALIVEGASLKKAAEILDIELPAARVLLGDFNKELEKSFSVARVRGKSKTEMELEITQRILEGEGFIEIGNSMALCRESVLRYFLRCLRSNKEDVLRVINT